MQALMGHNCSMNCCYYVALSIHKESTACLTLLVDPNTSAGIAMLALALSGLS
jgi:hypothetical protein